MPHSPRATLFVVLMLALLCGGPACKRDTPRPTPGEPPPGEATFTPAEPAPAAEEPPPPGVFVWTSAEPRAIDPALVNDTTGMAIALNLFEGLLVAAPGDGPPRPGVADRVDVSADGRTYTFHLRDDARWSDGTPVTADDFVWSWRRLLDPATGSPGAEDLWRLEYGKAWNEGRVSDPEAVGAHAIEPRTLSVTLERPDPLFPLELTGSRWLPVPRAAVTAHGAEWTRPEHIVSNGPFLLESWAPGERLVLKRNPAHWAATDVKLARAILRFTESEATAVRWYEAGLVHYTPGQVAFEKLVALQRAGRTDLRLDPYLGVSYLAFQVGRPPFDDPRVRRAFDLAVDKAGLIDATLRGGQQPASHLLPDGYRAFAGYEGPKGPGLAPEEARDLLAAAGYPGGVGFPRVTLVFNTSDVLERMMTFIAEQWRRHLGVEVTLAQQEWKTYLTRVRTGEFDIARFAMAGGVDPADLLHVLRSDNTNNLGGWKSDRFDGLLDELLREPDRERRFALVAEAEGIVVEETPVLPLYFYTRPALLHPGVRGFEPQSRDVHLLRYLETVP